MPIPNNYNLDRVFKLAGFPYGRPVAERPDTFVETGVNSWDILVNLFDDDFLDYLSDHIVSRSVAVPTGAGNNPVYEHLLGAEILSALTDAGYTPLGRSFETTSSTFGDVTESYVDGDELRAKQRRQVSSLRNRAVSLTSLLQASTVSTAFRDSEIDPREIEELRLTYSDTFTVTGLDSFSRIADINLNEGAYIGTLTFDATANTTMETSAYMRSPSGKLHPLYPVETELSSGFTRNVTLTPIGLLAEESGEYEFSFYTLVASGVSAQITNIRLSLFPLWGDISDEIAGLADGSVTVPKLANAVAARLIPTPIGSDNQILRVNGDVLGFEDLPEVDTSRFLTTINDGSITLAKLADAVAARLLPAVIGGDDEILRVNGNVLEYESLPTIQVGDGEITLAKLASAVAARLLPTETRAGRMLSTAVNPAGMPVWTDIGNSVASALRIPNSLGTRGKVMTVRPDGLLAEWADPSVADGAITLAKLASAIANRLLPAVRGSNGQVLTVTNNAVGWAAAASGGGSLPTSRRVISPGSAATRGTSSVSITLSEAIAAGNFYEIEASGHGYKKIFLVPSEAANNAIWTERMVLFTTSSANTLQPHFATGGRVGSTTASIRTLNVPATQSYSWILSRLV